MAESVKVIDPNSGTGYDYTCLFDWEAAQQADIDTSNTQAVAKCRCTGGTADTTILTIDGWTTSSSDFIKIWTDTTETYRHNGTFQTGNHYRFVHTNTCAINVVEDFVRIDGIAFNKTTGSSADDPSVYSNSGTSTSSLEVTNCVFKCSATETVGNYSSAIQQGWNKTGTALIRNCIIYGWQFSSSTKTAAIWCEGGTWTVQNVTIVNSYIGLGNTSGTLTTTNVGMSNVTTATSGTIGQTTNSTTTPTFLNAAADDFHLDPTDVTWYDAGTNLSGTFTTDIDLQTRVTWDIGADEYIATSYIEQEGFRFRNDDGSETTATWKANQDVNITLAANTAFRLRFLLKATGNPDSIDAQVEARVKPSGGAFGAWEKIN